MGLGLRPPVLARVQKVVADIQFRPAESLMFEAGGKTASVHGELGVFSFVLSYQKMSMTSEAL
jgi:hypothetical protein